MKRSTRRRPPALLLCFTCLWLAGACSRNPADKGETSAGKGPSPAATALDLEPVMPEAVQAVFERSCKTCHGPDAHGIASVGPDLRRSPRRTAEDWERYLRDPKSLHPSSKMPVPVGLNDEEIQAVAAYLADLTQNNPSPQQDNR